MHHAESSSRSISLPIYESHIQNEKNIAIQPVTVSVDVSSNGDSDDQDYNKECQIEDMCKEITLSKDAFQPFELANTILKNCESSFSPSSLTVKVEFEKLPLMSKSAVVELISSTSRSIEIGFLIEQLRLAPNVAGKPKALLIDVTCKYHGASEWIGFNVLERSIAEFAYSLDHESTEKFISTLCAKILICLGDENASVSIRSVEIGRSPHEESAFTVSRSLADLSHGERMLCPDRRDPVQNGSTKTTACLALGSNLGDRFRNIELALRYLDDYRLAFPESTDFVSENIDGDISVIDTSFLYETAPMYVTEQPSFLNCACLIETTLRPTSLLRVVKQIEQSVGRVPSFRNGPRAVDVDIVTFGSQIFDSRPTDQRGTLDNLEGQIVVPHPRLAEREFVLRPLNDIIPNWVHPQFLMSITSLLKAVLLSKPANEPPMHKVTPFPAYAPSKEGGIYAPPTQTYWTLPDRSQLKPYSKEVKPHRTFIMATLNVTPDSFSDGSLHYNIDDALHYVSDSLKAGADIIDIGGYSTRPGAAFVSTEEEIQRVVPVIKAIRSDASLKDVLISVDTFRWEVAQFAVESGANCINDVYAFYGPDYPPSVKSIDSFNKMRQVAHNFGVPVIMMHARGDAGSNKDYSAFTTSDELPTSPSPVLNAVRVELGEKVYGAITGQRGIRRWNVFVDPGIGFSKTVEDNLELLRHASEITADCELKGITSTTSLDMPCRNPLAGFPMLIGTSRKSFLGTILSSANPPANPGPQETKSQNRPANERDFATAAAVSCAVQQGAAIVRVHEVQAMADVVKVASALWP